MVRRAFALGLALVAAAGLTLGALLLRLDVGGSDAAPVWSLLVPTIAVVAGVFGVAGVAVRRPHVTFVGVVFLFLAAWGTFFSHAPVFLGAAALFLLATRVRGHVGATERGALWVIGTLSATAGLVVLAARVYSGEVARASLYVDLGLPAALLLVAGISWWPARGSHAKHPVAASA